MSGVTGGAPKGVLRRGWNATVDEYAVAGGWALGGERLIVGDASGSVFGFEGTSGTVTWSQAGFHRGGVLAVATHPGGSITATAGQDGRVSLWEAASGQALRMIETGPTWVEQLAWSPDGRLLAASCSKQASVFAADGTLRWSSSEHGSTVSALAWTKQGELVTSCYGRVSFFDVEAEGGDGELRQALDWKGSLVSMVLSPDGDVVACGSQDKSVHFWRRSSGEDSMMSGYPTKPAALAFDDSGTLLATSGGDAVTVWSFLNGGPEGTRPGVLDLHVQPVSALAFAPRSLRLASGGREGAVVVWSLRRNGDGDPIGVAMVEGAVAQVCWRADGRGLGALDANGGVTVWRVGS